MTTTPQPTVAIISTTGNLTLTHLTPSPAGRPWHHGLQLARTGPGIQFWTRPTPGSANLTATELADALAAQRLSGLLTGEVLVCGAGGDTSAPESVPPLAVALHTPIEV